MHTGLTFTLTVLPFISFLRLPRVFLTLSLNRSYLAIRNLMASGIWKVNNKKIGIYCSHGRLVFSYAYYNSGLAG